LSPQPIAFQSLINSFYFNALQENKEKSNSCANGISYFNLNKPIEDIVGIMA
jgi:hypothetical protein